MKTFKGLEGLGERRRALGLSMAQAAEATGVTRQAWHSWETGQATPLASYLPAIAATLGCRMEELFEAPAANEKALPGATPAGR